MFLEHELDLASSVLVFIRVLVFEHVTQQFLHGCVTDDPVKEQLLYFL